MNAETLQQTLEDKLNYNLWEDLNSSKTQPEAYSKCYTEMVHRQQGECSGVALWKQTSQFNW